MFFQLSIMTSIYVIAYSALPGNPEFAGLECYDDRHSEFTSLEEAKSFCADLRAQGNWSIDDHLLDSDPIELEDNTQDPLEVNEESVDPIF